MGSIKGKILKYIRDPRRLYLLATSRGLTKWVPDELHLKITFKISLGYPLDLDNPTTFNEKLQWLKLHDRNPLYTTLVDKYRVKQWVADRIGPEYVTPVYGVWERVEDIDLDALPEQFVLKTNHDCGGIAICRDRATFDFEAAKKKLNKHLHRNYYWGGREWPYKDVKPLVFAEEYLEDAVAGELSGCAPRTVSAPDMVDYKFLCYGGKTQCLFTCTGRAAGDLRVDFFDLDWNHLPFTRHYQNADVPPEAPSGLRNMIEASEALASGIPFVRVDFYEVAGRDYFGEMTFYPGSGFEEFDSRGWDERLGSWIELPAGGGHLLVSDSWTLWLHGAGTPAQSGAQTDSPALTDYKFYCFGGDARFVLACTGRGSDLRMDFFDRDWNHLPFTRHYPNADVAPGAPVRFSEMRAAAERLAGGLPFVRADFYEVGGRCYFGEMTFHPASGFGAFEPRDWDGRLGQLLELPNGGGVAHGEC